MNKQKFFDDTVAYAKTMKGKCNDGKKCKYRLTMRNNKIKKCFIGNKILDEYYIENLEGEYAGSFSVLDAIEKSIGERILKKGPGNDVNF